MNSTYKHPSEQLVSEQRFQGTEMGFRHLATGSFVRLCDDGSIQLIFGSKGDAGIIVDENGVTLFGDRINIMSGYGGFTWNGKEFNPCANRIDEPTLKEGSRLHRNPARGFEEYKE